jgi:hypothetical protein
VVASLSDGHPAGSYAEPPGSDDTVLPAPPSCSYRVGENARVPAYRVNEDAVSHAKRLIDARQYVLRSRWQDVQPRAREQNAFLKTHSWAEYSAWHLGLTEGAPEETKRRYAFVYGDLRRLHRMGLIACHYRAAEWRHKEIELAAHELLQYLDRKSASRRGRPGAAAPSTRAERG